MKKNRLQLIMKKFISLFMVLFVTQIWAQTSPLPLKFYIVSNEKITGGQFIDTVDLPKLGYINATPDLVITKLESATLNTNAVRDAVMIDKNGKETVVPSKSHSALLITLCSEDQKGFTLLTERAVGKRLLFMYGDMPLAAPGIREPIESSNLMITFGPNIDQKKVTDDFKKLIQKPAAQ